MTISRAAGRLTLLLQRGGTKNERYERKAQSRRVRDIVADNTQYRITYKWCAVHKLSPCVINCRHDWRRPSSLAPHLRGPRYSKPSSVDSIYCPVVAKQPSAAMRILPVSLSPFLLLSPAAHISASVPPPGFTLGGRA